MDTDKTVLQQLIEIRDGLDLSCPFVYIARVDGEVIKGVEAVGLLGRACTPLVTMNDGNEILADLAEVL